MTSRLRSAILQAADHIEKHPELFDYAEGLTPHCGTQACAAGWIGAFYGLEEGADITDREASESMLGVDYWTFDDRMDELNNKVEENWMRDAMACAQTLRLYADTYVPE